MLQPALLIQPCATLRAIENIQNSGKCPLTIRYEQIRDRFALRGNLHAHLLPGEVFRVLFLKIFDLRPFYQRRPCSHDVMPQPEYLSSTLLPISGGLDRATIIEL